MVGFSRGITPNPPSKDRTMDTPFEVVDGGPVDWDSDILYRFTAEDGSEDVGTAEDPARLHDLYQAAGSPYVVACYYQEAEPLDDGEHPSLSAADRNPSLR